MQYINHLTADVVISAVEPQALVQPSLLVAKGLMSAY